MRRRALQGGEDCTHSCHPSAYQVWIYDLVAVLRESLHRLPAPPRGPAAPAPAPAPAGPRRAAPAPAGVAQEPQNSRGPVGLVQGVMQRLRQGSSLSAAGAAERAGRARGGEQRGGAAAPAQASADASARLRRRRQRSAS